MLSFWHNLSALSKSWFWQNNDHFISLLLCIIILKSCSDAIWIAFVSDLLHRSMIFKFFPTLFHFLFQYNLCFKKTRPFLEGIFLQESKALSRKQHFFWKTLPFLGNQVLPWNDGFPETMALSRKQGPFQKFFQRSLVFFFDTCFFRSQNFFLENKIFFESKAISRKQIFFWK